MSPEAATDAAKGALQGMGYEIQSVTEELGQLRTKVRAVATPKTCDCGTWNGSEVSGNAESSFVVTTAAQGTEKVILRIEHTCATTFTGRNLYGGTTRQETYQCASRGIVERQFWDTLRKVLDARPASVSGK